MIYQIHAILKTHTPLHIASPGSLRFLPESGEITYNKETGIPCTAIQRLPFASENGTERLPIIAANNIAGRLRRHGAGLTVEILHKKNQKISLEAYSAIMCGAVTGSPDSQTPTYQEYKLTSHHPFLGLFGGGPRMLRRAFRANNAQPINALTSNLKLLKHPRESLYTQDKMRLTHAWAFRRLDDLAQLSNVDLQEQSIENYEKEIQARQIKILEEKTKSKSGEASGRTTTLTYSALEFVIPGIHFGLTFELDIKTLAQMGLFLLALDQFAAKERLGGYTRNEFGQFSLNDVVLMDESGIIAEDLFNNGRLVKEHEALIPFFEAWSIAADKLSADELQSLLALTNNSKEKEDE